MSDSKVFMLPENGYNNGSLGLGGWGGGILGFILIGYIVQRMYRMLRLIKVKQNG